MGMDGKRHHATGLASALFSPVQQRLLGLLFGQPERRFGSAELIRLAGGGTGAAHRFLIRLENVGLVTTSRTGNQKHYQANPKSPIFAELQALVVKTVGLLEPLRRALEPEAAKIRFAFVYGSIAKGTDTAKSDVDLLLVSDDLTHFDAYELLQPVEALLGREISPNVFGSDEWRRKKSEADSFAARIVRQPRLFVIGEEGDDD